MNQIVLWRWWYAAGAACVPVAGGVERASDHLGGGAPVQAIGLRERGAGLVVLQAQGDFEGGDELGLLPAAREPARGDQLAAPRSLQTIMKC
jgi:hypothetical protein